MFNFLYKIGNSIQGEELDLEVVELFPGDKNKDYVPAYTLKILLKKIKIGHLNLRIGEDANLKYYSGNIAYKIEEPFRGNSFAVKACILAKVIFIKHNFSKIYITCNPDNFASKRVCEKLGAKYLETVNVPKEHEIYQRGEKQKCCFEWLLNT